MQEFAVYGQGAGPGTLRLWVGFRGAPGVSILGVWVGEAAKQFHFDRVVAPVHAGSTDLFSCVVRVDDQLPGWHWATVQLTDGRALRIATRVLPPRLARGETLRVLLGSCFHQDSSARGIFEQFMLSLAPAARPDLTLLMGDQVYLDLPPERAFPDDERWLTAYFRDAYQKNWFDRAGLAPLLGIAPTICSPDDHEYWNNYPEPATIIQNSWSEGGRARWERPASQLYDAFQRPGMERDGVSLLRVDPLSFCVVDTRSSRSIGAKRFFDVDRATRKPAGEERTRKAIEGWLEGLGPDDVGILVTGQSILEAAEGKLLGRFGDYALADHSESYDALIASIDKAARRIAGMVLLTGDVHWSRVTRVHERGVALIHEVISSPMSLLGAPFVDRLKELRGVFTNDAWPRHKAPPDPPRHFARAQLGNRYESEKRAGQKGNRIAMLEFTPGAERGCALSVRSFELKKPFDDEVTDITLNRVQ